MDFVVGTFHDVSISPHNIFFLIITLASDIKTNIFNVRSVANRNLFQPTEVPDDMFTYKDPPPAGRGTDREEIRRYRLFLSRHGAICQDIRHFGGRYMQGRDPPEYEPDGTWYLCLDPEASLTPKSCIVYSVG